MTNTEAKLSPNEQLQRFFDELGDVFHTHDPEVIDRFLEASICTFDPLHADDGETEASVEKTLVFSSVLNEAASWYRNSSRFPQSEAYYKQALASLEDAGQERSSQFARIVINLAGLYRHMRKFEQAESSYGKALQILESLSELDRYAIASVMNNQALLFLEMDESERALETAQRAATILRECDEADVHQIATSLVNIAGIQSACGDLESAAASAEEANRLFNSKEREDVHHAAALNMLGTIRYRQGKFEEAASLYEQALSSTQHFFSRNIEYATCEENLAKTYEVLGNHDAARAHAAVACETIENLLPKDDRRYVQYRDYLSKLESRNDRQ